MGATGAHEDLESTAVTPSQGDHSCTSTSWGISESRQPFANGNVHPSALLGMVKASGAMGKPKPHLAPASAPAIWLPPLSAWVASSQ